MVNQFLDAWLGATENLVERMDTHTIGTYNLKWQQKDVISRVEVKNFLQFIKKDYKLKGIIFSFFDGFFWIVFS